MGNLSVTYAALAPAVIPVNRNEQIPFVRVKDRYVSYTGEDYLYLNDAANVADVQAVLDLYRITRNQYDAAGHLRYHDDSTSADAMYFFGGEHKRDPITGALLYYADHSQTDPYTGQAYRAGDPMRDLFSGAIVLDPFGQPAFHKVGDPLLAIAGQRVLCFRNQMQRWLGGEQVYYENGGPVTNADGSPFLHLPGQVRLHNRHDPVLNAFGAWLTYSGGEPRYYFGDEELTVGQPRVDYNGDIMLDADGNVLLHTDLTIVDRFGRPKYHGRGDPVYVLISAGANPLVLENWVQATYTAGTRRTYLGNEPWLYFGGEEANYTAADPLQAGQPMHRVLVAGGMPGEVFYDHLEHVSLTTGSGTDHVLVVQTHSGDTTIATGAGEEVVNVRAISGATSVSTGDGNDIVNVGRRAGFWERTLGLVELLNVNGTLNGIDGLLTLDGGSDLNKDQLNLDDTGDGSANVGNLETTRIYGLGLDDDDPVGGITYSGFEGLELSLGSGGNVLAVAFTQHLGDATVVNSGSGSDNCTIAVTGASEASFILNGGAGDDVLTATTTTVPLTVCGGAGDDGISGGGADDVIDGGAGVDTIQGGPGDDVVRGGAGEDILDGGTGDDVLDAGTGVVNILSGGDGADLIFGSDEGQDDPNFGDRIYFGDIIDGGLSVDEIWGLGGADVIAGGDGDDRIDGGIHGDYILGEAGADLVYGWRGDDIIEGGAGNDDLYGELDDDTLRGDDGDDILDGGAGVDTLEGGVGIDELHGGGGAGDSLSGGPDDDILYGSDDGGDILSGGVGQDVLFGRGGNDAIAGDAGNDQIDGGPGDDTIQGGAGIDLLVGGAGHDTLYGFGISTVGDDRTSDYLYGDFGTNGNEPGSGRDRLYGNGGNDLLYGEGEDDLIQAVAGYAVSEVGGGGSNLVDFGAPGDDLSFVAPAPTPAPMVQPAVANSPRAVADLPTGVDHRGRWMGLAGSTRTRGVSGGGGVSVEPVVVAGPTAQYVAWVDSRNGVFQIYAARHTTDSWQELAASASGGGVSNLLASARRPSLALNSAGQPLVAWTQFSGGTSDIHVAQYDPMAGGGTGAWVSLGSSLAVGGISQTGAADFAHIVHTTNGPMVVWLDASSGTAQAYARIFSGSSWVEADVQGASLGGVSAWTSDLQEVAVTASGARVAVAWTARDSLGIEQVFVREFNGGAWSELAGSASGSGVSKTGLASRTPSAAYYDGELFVAWQQAGDALLFNDTCFARFDGTAWTLPQAVLGRADLNGSAGQASLPKLAAAAGDLYLVWADVLEGVAAEQKRVLYSARWDSDEFVEEIPGDAVSDGIFDIAGSYGTFDLAVDSAGHAFAVWQQLAGGVPEVFLRADTVDCTTIYPADGTAGQTVQEILDAHNLGAGDVILVQGTHANGFAVRADDAGVAILGVPGATIRAAVVIESGADDILIQRLAIDDGNPAHRATASRSMVRHGSPSPSLW